MDLTINLNDGGAVAKTMAVIVPGAGSGTRFGGARNKIFAKIGPQAMFLKTLEAFASREDVCQVIFVCSPSDREEIVTTFGGSLGFMGVTLVVGGATRTESVRNALAAVCDEAEFVAVHDAARPCVAQAWIDAVFAEARASGAALLARPIFGTIKRVDESEKVEETLPRAAYGNLWEAQTPQVFAREILEKAYQNDANATDDAAMVEALGYPVSIVPGDPRNIKVTTADDLTFAQAVIGTLPKPKEKRAFHPFQDE